MEINLLELRKERNESQDDLAKILGVTRQAYSKYERNERELGYDALSLLAKHFDVSIDYLLGNSTYYYPDKIGDYLTEEEKNLLAGYRDLEPKMKQAILTTVKSWSTSSSVNSDRKNA